jgi:hypothetical protein
MLSKEVFDKATLRYKTTKNPDENPYLAVDFINLKKKSGEPNVSRLLSNVCDFHLRIYCPLFYADSPQFVKRTEPIGLGGNTNSKRI